MIILEGGIDGEYMKYEEMDDLIILYEKYNKGEYDIADISRILSYIALPDEMNEDIEKAEYRIENIRFLL